jgi:protease I
MRILDNKKIALLATDGFEDSELNEPMKAIKDAGAEVVVISNKSNFEGKNGTKLSADKLVEDVSADEYDGLLLPGGVKNPDIMRMNESAISFVKDFFVQHKPVAAICHAPGLLIEADIVKDRKVTSWPSLKTDLINAGANYFDEEVVVDHGLVTSRSPDDLPAFCAKTIEEFGEGKHSEQTT